MFGQELFFGGLDKNAIQNALQVPFQNITTQTSKALKFCFFHTFSPFF